MHRGRRAARESEGGLPRTGSWDATAAHALAQKRGVKPSQKYDLVLYYHVTEPAKKTPPKTPKKTFPALKSSFHLNPTLAEAPDDLVKSSQTSWNWTKTAPTPTRQNRLLPELRLQTKETTKKKKTKKTTNDCGIAATPDRTHQKGIGSV